MKTACRSARLAGFGPGACPALALALALAGLALPALAQYKVLGPDGHVTYTDRPPADAGLRVSPLQRQALIEAPAADTLPADLRRAATRYPVTLYVAADCAPCDSGRQLLQQRGVPYAEKLIATEDDAKAMERLLATRTVPTLTIGSQALNGLSAPEWSAYLDAAGYPRESQLPRNWKATPAEPLASRPTPRPEPTPQAAVMPAAPSPAPAVSPPPSGTIRF
jgi:glutaredoxin